MVIAVMVAFLASVYIVWRIVGAVLKLVIFLVVFAAGYCVAYGIGQFGGHPQEPWVYALEALALAWAVNLIRAKIARTVAMVAILAVGRLTGWFGLGTKAIVPEPQGSKLKQAQPHKN